MPMSAREYAEKAEKLFVLPDVYLRLKEIMDDETASLEDIGNVIALDPALSSTLLKIANSALFSFPREIDSISKAISILGTNQVHNLINTYGTTAAFFAVDNTVIDLDRFWEISVDCALLCKFLAQKKKIKNTQGIFVCGLLHNIGELVVLQSQPKVVQYCQGYSKDETPWQRQHDILGFTYADCSAELLSLWHLPQHLVNPIKQYHHAYANELDEASSLLYVCSRLALINSYPGMYSKRTFPGVHLMKELGISAIDVEEALNFCNVEGLAILSMLRLNSKGA
jgi:HD-like signal output (HDOD) protein